MPLHLWDLPNEILLKIFSYIKGEKNLFLVCKKFYQLMTVLNEFNIKLEIEADYVINPNFNFDELLIESSFLDVSLIDEIKDKRFDEKFTTFLKSYGNKITSYSHKSPTPLNITKFIHLMPNLNTLAINKKMSSFPVLNGIKINSIPLKKLIITTFNDITWNMLNIFDIEELIIHNLCSNIKFSRKSFIYKWKNLKKVLLTSSLAYTQLMYLLKRKKLESLTICLNYLKKEDIEEFFKTQKHLKELKVENFESHNLFYICANLDNLEKLHLKFVRNWKSENIAKISHLKNLKSLQIEQKLDQETIQRFLNLSRNLKNLECLTIEINFNIRRDMIQKLAENFSNLKSFDIEISSNENYYKIFTNILEIFNKIEKLYVKSNCKFTNYSTKVDENFYTTQHTNLNLKILHFYTHCFESEKLKQKLLRDFSNLKEFSEQYKNSLSFDIDLNSAENVNELLKDCSVEFSDTKNSLRAVKDGRKIIKFNLKKYFNDQQLKTTLSSSRNLKSIQLNIPNCDNENSVKNVVNYITAVGEHVTELSILSECSVKLFNIKLVIESFPNLEVVNFQKLNFDRVFEQIYKAKNEKIKKVIMNFHALDNEATSIDVTINNIVVDIETFCNNFRFSSNTLEQFKIIITGDWYFHLTFEKPSMRKFLKDQNKLTEKKEGHELDCEWQDRFVFEAWSK